MAAGAKCDSDYAVEGDNLFCSALTWSWKEKSAASGRQGRGDLPLRPLTGSWPGSPGPRLEEVGGRSGGPQGGSPCGDIGQTPAVRGGPQVGCGERKRGHSGRTGRAAGQQPRRGFSGSLTWPGLWLMNLLVFLASVGCLLNGGEKDVRLIPTLIKTASRLNMYEHILIWGLNRGEN